MRVNRDTYQWHVTRSARCWHVGCDCSVCRCHTTLSSSRSSCRTFLRGTYRARPEDDVEMSLLFPSTVWGLIFSKITSVTYNIPWKRFEVQAAMAKLCLPAEKKTTASHGNWTGYWAPLIWDTVTLTTRPSTPTSVGSTTVIWQGLGGSKAVGEGVAGGASRSLLVERFISLIPITNYPAFLQNSYKPRDS